MNETIKMLEESLKKEGFGVLWKFSVTEKLQEKFHEQFLLSTRA
ncbi:hypothetical protein [Geobacillus subterraneus]|nr:hypothetical protein [Geobacillus subterraneus]